MTAPDGCAAPKAGDAPSPGPDPAAIRRACRDVVRQTERAARAGFDHDPQTACLRSVLLLETLADAAETQEMHEEAFDARRLEQIKLAETWPATTPVGIIGRLALVAIDLTRDDPQPGRALATQLGLLLNAIAGVAASGGVPLALPARATRPIATQADIDHWAAAEQASEAEPGLPA